MPNFSGKFPLHLFAAPAVALARHSGEPLLVGPACLGTQLGQGQRFQVEVVFGAFDSADRFAHTQILEIFRIEEGKAF
jgi:hypothetical protein